MNLDINIILNVLIALTLYKVVIQSIGFSVMKTILNSKPLEETRKEFKDKLKEKLEGDSNK